MSCHQNGAILAKTGGEISNGKTSTDKRHNGNLPCHVIGLDGRNIFLADSYRSIFMEKLNKARENGGFQLYAHCLVDNHVHPLK